MLQHGKQNKLSAYFKIKHTTKNTTALYKDTSVYIDDVKSIELLVLQAIDDHKKGLYNNNNKTKLAPHTTSD